MTSFGPDKTRENLTKAKISMFCSGIFMGNVGILVTFLSNYSLATIVLLRGIFGTFFLTIYMIWSKSFNIKFIKESIKSHWKHLLIIGITNPLVILLYFLNITLYGYSIAAFLLYTSGLFLLIFLIIEKEENVSKINVFSFILGMIGVAIIMEFWTGNLLITGIIIGVFSGLFLGILVFSKKKIYNVRDKNPEITKLKGNFDIFLSWWVTLFLILVFLPIGATDLLKLSVYDIIFSLLLGFFPTALAFTLYNIGVKKDKGGNIVILSYFEPIMASINTAIFLKNLSIYTIIGGVLIIFGNILVLKYSK